MDPFLQNNPALRRRYERELRALGSNCRDCDKGALERKYRRLEIEAMVKPVIKADLKKERRAR